MKRRMRERIFDHKSTQWFGPCGAWKVVYWFYLSLKLLSFFERKKTAKKIFGFKFATKQISPSNHEAARQIDSWKKCCLSTGIIVLSKPLHNTTLWLAFVRKKRSDKEKFAKKHREKLNSYENSTKICFVLSISQVWFQNKRSKERRLKQLTSMGRGPFFGGSRKMRGFPMNLSPGGLDEPGFPYFGSDKFDFGYGGPPFHPHDSPFFPGHPGMPFNGPG